MEKKCITCGLRSDAHCKVLNIDINLQGPACQLHDPNPLVCEICGAIVLVTNSILHSDNMGDYHRVCGRCNSRLASCAGCKLNGDCAFETDPSPIPHVVQKQIRQGPMTQIIQVRNPDRIAITCAAGCECWSAEDKACNRECGCCGRYECIWE